MSEHQLPKQLAGLSRLVQIEWEARQARDDQTLAYIAVNDSHRLIPYDHALMWSARANRVVAVSGALKVEPQAPQIVWFGKLCKFIATSDLAGEPHALSVSNFPGVLAGGFGDWINSGATWVPFSGGHSRLEGGMILLRERTFNEAELRTLNRLGNAYGSALSALQAPAPRLRDVVVSRRIKQALAVMAIVGVLAIRLPMTVLAEARVAPSEPMVVSAPIEGVISKIYIKPNQVVVAGQKLLRFDQTELHASHEVAFKRVAVLKSDSQRAEAQAFNDPKARAQISLLRAKLAEGLAEYAFARRRLAKTLLRSPANGIALIDDVNEWIGRPVKTGERILIVADPGKALLEIDVGVEDATFVTKGAKVEFFLATAPSQPIEARLKKISYTAQMQPDQTTKFIAQAHFSASVVPRLGLTGTAKILGPQVSLGYMLFRKPLAKLRRLVGF